MSLESLTRTDFPTALGVIPLWHRADALRSQKPVMLSVTGAFAVPDTMSKMQAVVGEGCECFLMHLPGNHTPPITEMTVAGFGRALSELISREFAERPVVLQGISIGALTALAVRAAPVRRIVAVEPPLITGKLWPMLDALAEMVATNRQDASLAAFVDGVFGVSADGKTRSLSYLDLFDDLDVPVDLVIGDQPLMPQRQVPHYPSFVDEPERRILAEMDGVEVHVGANAGHNIPFHDPFLLREVLLRALHAVGGAPPLSDADRHLLAKAPVAARRVLYLGGAWNAFEAEYRRVNPTVDFQGSDHLSLVKAQGFDLAVCEKLPKDLGALAAVLTEEGCLLTPAGPRELAPFSILRVTPAHGPPDAFDDLRPPPPTGGEVVLARKGAGEAPLHLLAATFAPRLMDLRTRMPAQAMRTDPDLVVALSNPAFDLNAVPYDQPKVLILQRPALMGADAWRHSVSMTLKAGWVVVMEFDDHPELVAAVKGEVVNADTWARFGYVHAVQTSTPQLAAAFGAYNPEVKIFPNCVFDLPPFPEQPAPRRVFYGAVTRGRFAVDVAATFGPVATEFPEVEWLVLGDRDVHVALPAANKRFVDYVDYDEYLRLMGTCAVSLSPIEGLPHQETKSDAKYIEAASRGVVTLASPTIYAASIRHGETGLIAERPQDWAPLLAGLLRDEPARGAIARAAWEDVRTTRMFAQQLPERRRWYRDLWDRREELTDGLMERLPGLREAMAR